MDGAVQAGERAAHEVLEDLILASGEGDSTITREPFCEVEPPSAELVAHYSGMDAIERYSPNVPTVVAGLGITGMALAWLASQFILPHCFKFKYV